MMWKIFSKIGLLSFLFCLEGPLAGYGVMDQEFSLFLQNYVDKVAEKEKQCNLATWILETTGSEDAASLVGSLRAEYQMLFSDKNTYQKLVAWQKDKGTNEELNRQLDILVDSFLLSMASPDLIKEISNKEAELSRLHANFRAKIDGMSITENDLVEKLKSEKDPAVRKKVWEATKEVGDFLAPKILEVVRLRNQLAKSLGFSDYFVMQMKLQEVDTDKLFTFFDELAAKSSSAYAKLLGRIEKEMSKTYGVSKENLGPWAWKDPFGQEDPLAVNLDNLIKGTDVVQVAREFYKKMNQPAEKVLEKSDLYEREKKSQHAFCIDIDRSGDVRTLDNIRPTLRWMDTILHELGHGIYELGFDSTLPWLLRSPPHIMTTEAMALFAGRQAYSPEFYKEFFPQDKEKQELSVRALESQKRRQLIFSRWVFVMTFFEKELYKNPEQDLNALWWSLVEKYQGICPPQGREKHHDWAAKTHITTNPVYYYSYLLGEVFASSLNEMIWEKEKCHLWSPKAGEFLQKNLFAPGNRYRWDVLIEKVLGEPLRSDAWVREFAKE